MSAAVAVEMITQVRARGVGGGGGRMEQQLCGTEMELIAIWEGNNNGTKEIDTHN